MGRVPQKLQEFITFGVNHANIFDLNHTALGIPALSATAFKTQMSTNQGYYTAQINAQEAAVGATGKQQASTSQSRQMLADLIRAIDLTAANSADPASIYALAQVPAPASASPSAPPGTPANFKVALDDDGSVILSWKCENPVGTSGTIYEVRRKPAGTQAWTFIGATGIRKFVDDTILSGSSPVTYQITAVRSTQRGQPASYNVTFGIDGGGGLAGGNITFTEVTENPAQKAVA